MHAPLALVDAVPALASLQAGGPVLLADDGDLAAALIAAPFVAVVAVFAAVYGGIHRYYRNKDKRHAFERESDVQVGNLQTHDQRTGSKNRQRSARMANANDGSPLDRVGRIKVE